MRFSTHKSSQKATTHPPGASHQKLLDGFGKLGTKTDLSGALLLVGGRDFRSLSVRHAQTSLRYLDAYRRLTGAPLDLTEAT